MLPPGRAGAEEAAVEDDGDDRAPAVRREVLGLDDEVARGVVDEDVDAAEALDRRSHQRVDRLGVADVRRHGEARAGAEERDRLLQRLGPPARRRPPRRRARPSSSAIARPRPLPPPVTIATLPSNVPSASISAQDDTRVEAERAVAAVTSSGLISISAISGCSAATRESAAAARAAAPTSTGGRPRAPSRSGATAQRAEERLGRLLRHRRERDGDVLDDLRVEAARADEQDRPEARVALRARRSARRRRESGAIARPSTTAAQAPSPSASSASRSSPASREADGDAAGVRLVQPPERLENDRVADLLRRRRAPPRSPRPCRASAKGTPAVAEDARGLRSSRARPRRGARRLGELGDPEERLAASSARAATRRRPLPRPRGRPGTPLARSVSAGRRLPVHRVREEAARRSPRPPRAIALGRLDLLLPEVVRVLRVAAEVAGEDHRVDLARARGAPRRRARSS